MTSRFRSVAPLVVRTSAVARAVFVAWARWRSALTPILPF
jgi:hypothetical protein